MNLARMTMILLATMIVAGCQTTQEQQPPQLPPSPSSAAVSSIPWNKPASWEGAGALGGFMPQGGH